MNEYTSFHNRLSTLEEEQKPRSGWATNVIVLGVLATLACSGLAYVYSEGTSGVGLGPLIFTVLIGVSVIVTGILVIVSDRRRIDSVNQEYAALQAKLEPLNQTRADLLTRIRSGDFDTFTSFMPYVLQEQPIDLAPTTDVLAFRPQKGESCFAQVHDVALGRIKSRTVTQKVGGGYRVVGVYVPVRKERVQVTEMQRLDTGLLTITNLRILYLGVERKLTIKWDKVLELSAYQDGLSVTKEGRKSADFFLDVDGELLAAIIDGIEGRAGG
jgi:hypothetical protein